MVLYRDPRIWFPSPSLVWSWPIPGGGTRHREAVRDRWEANEPRRWRGAQARWSPWEACGAIIPSPGRLPGVANVTNRVCTVGLTPI